MLAQKVARKYASALFLSTREKGLIDVGFEQLGGLREYVAKDMTLLNFLSSPDVLEESKRSLVRDVFGDRMERLFVEFLIVLIDKNRIAFLAEIIDEFTRLVKAEKGIGLVTAITAVPLREPERAELVERMATRTGLKIELEEKVDLSILGGMIVILHNEIIDGSVRHGLDLIKEQLVKVRVY